MKIVINPKYEHLRNWITQLPDNFNNEGEMLYNGRNQVKRFNDINIKRFCKPLLINRIAYLFRGSKAKRAYSNALRLLDLNIPTPEPIAYLENHHFCLLTESYLLTQQCAYPRRMYEFGEGDMHGREHILVAFGKLTALMHEKGVYHKDFSPGNILFNDNNGEVKFMLVDINRMEFGKVNQQKGCDNFSRLWCDEDMLKVIVREYAKYRGFDANECEQQAIQSWHRFWQTRKGNYFQNYKQYLKNH